MQNNIKALTVSETADIDVYKRQVSIYGKRHYD